MWAPWLALGAAVLLSPSARDMQYRENYLEGEVLARAQREYMHRVPVTPKESAAWVGLCDPSFASRSLLFVGSCPHDTVLTNLSTLPPPVSFQHTVLSLRWCLCLFGAFSGCSIQQTDTFVTLLPTMLRLA